MWARIFENYEASDSGLIRNAKTGRQVKQYVGKDGYLRTQIAGKTRLVHRLIAIAFVAADPGKDFVNHKDGNKQNNRACNLEWVTSKQNTIHAIEHGLLIPKNGCELYNSRIKEEDVRNIRKRLKNKERQCDIARDYNVSNDVIYHIAHNQSYRNVV